MDDLYEAQGKNEERLSCRSDMAMKGSAVLLVSAFLSAFPVFCGGEEYRPASAWLLAKRSEVEKLRHLDDNERIEKLGSLLGALDRYGDEMTPDQRALFQIIQSELLGIPDLADHFRTKLEDLKKDRGNEVSYDRQRSRCFETMRFIPKPEVVGVLGELLEDHEDELSPLKEGQDYSDTASNSKLAAMTLGRLLEKPPVQGKPNLYFKHDLETWKLWYAQVKAGTRGFQFKRDPRIHYLAKSGDKPNPGPETTPSPAAPDSIVEKVDHPAATVPSKRPFPLIGTLIASGLLLLSIGWMIVSKRRAMAGRS